MRSIGTNDNEIDVVFPANFEEKGNVDDRTAMAGSLALIQKVDAGLSDERMHDRLEQLQALGWPRTSTPNFPRSTTPSTIAPGKAAAIAGTAAPR